mgnify:CR=1 FL=1
MREHVLVASRLMRKLRGGMTEMELEAELLDIEIGHGVATVQHVIELIYLVTVQEGRKLAGPEDVALLLEGLPENMTVGEALALRARASDPIALMMLVGIREIHNGRTLQRELAQGVK